MSLTPEQDSALQQLWAITSSETTSARDRDERLLRENGWDVQVSSTTSPFSSLKRGQLLAHGGANLLDAAERSTEWSIAEFQYDAGDGDG